MDATNDAAATQRWEGLFKEQPNARIQLNELPHMKDTFTDITPKLNVMDLNVSDDTSKCHSPSVTLSPPWNKNGYKRRHKPCKQTNKKQKLCAGDGSLNLTNHLVHDQLITNATHRQKIREDIMKSFYPREHMIQTLR